MKILNSLSLQFIYWGRYPFRRNTPLSPMAIISNKIFHFLVETNFRKIKKSAEHFSKSPGKIFLLQYNLFTACWYLK